MRQKINISELVKKHLLNEDTDEHISSLLQYFQEKPLNFDNGIIRQFFTKFVEQEENYNLLLDTTGEFVDLDSVHDNKTYAQQVFNSFPPEKQEEFHNFYVNNKPIDPIIEPAYKFIDVKKELPPDTLIVRFVGNGQFKAVQKEGFRLGLSDFDKLHATEYYDKSFKQKGGYIFGYVADSEEAKKQAKATEVGQSYGANCIFFRHSGLLIYHKLDGEQQVLTYGLNVRPEDCIFAKGFDDGEFILVNGPFDKGPKSYSQIVREIEKI